MGVTAEVLANAAILADAKRIAMWGRQNGLLTIRAHPGVAAAVTQAGHEKLSLLVHSDFIQGAWTAVANGVRRYGPDAESAARSVGLVVLRRQKKALRLPGPLNDDDDVEAEPISRGTWKITWNPGGKRTDED